MNNAIANMSVYELDALVQANMGFSLIETAGGLDTLLDQSTVEEVRQEVAALLECIA